MALSQSIPRLSRSARVLVVDDERVNRLVASSFCEMFGANVDTAESGAEAIYSCSVTDYDVVLMDIRMPEIDGIEATTSIRLLGDYAQRMPIVAVTADEGHDLRKRCASVGITTIIIKPLQKSIMFDLLQGILDAEIEAVSNRLAPFARSA